MIETIFFDLGGVLINFSHEKMFQNLAAFCNLDANLIKEELYQNKWSENYEKGVVDSKQLHKHLSTLSGLSLDYHGLLEAASDIFTPKEETEALLDTLKKQGVKLFLLSNTCEAHIAYVRKHFNILPFFDGLILSYEWEVRKPEKMIYDVALAAAKCPGKRCFYVDDVAEYVEAAKSYGIDSHHYQNLPELNQALEKRGFKTNLPL